MGSARLVAWTMSSRPARFSSSTTAPAVAIVDDENRAGLELIVHAIQPRHPTKLSASLRCFAEDPGSRCGTARPR